MIFCQQFYTFFIPGLFLVYFSVASAAEIPRENSKLIIGGQSYSLSAPLGYKLELLTRLPGGPRLMAFDAENNLFVGSKSGKIFRLSPPYNKSTVYSKLGNYPHSIAFTSRHIFVAQIDGVYRAKYAVNSFVQKASEFKRIFELPDTGGHSSRTIAIGPDNRLYVSLGISRNCSDEYLSEAYPWSLRKGGFYVLDNIDDKPTEKIYASGLRNPVGYDWQPVTKKLYASNNGPDHLGFDLPPEYFSEIKENSFNGMPWYQFNGKQIIRDKCIKKSPPFPADIVPEPVATFPARNAPMGVYFIRSGSIFPQYVNSAVVALHGSWAINPDRRAQTAAASRRQPKLVLVKFNKKQKAESVVDFVTGFQLNSGDRMARPVGVIQGPDGNIYFTSDEGIEGLFRLVKTH